MMSIQLMALVLATILGGALTIYVPRALKAYVRIWTAGEAEDRAVVTGVLVSILAAVSLLWAAFNFINL